MLGTRTVLDRKNLLPARNDELLMNQKQLNQRLDVIRRFCREAADDIQGNPYRLERIVHFTAMLNGFYFEIEENLVERFKSFYDKQRAIKTQTCINNLIDACEGYIGNELATD